MRLSSSKHRFFFPTLSAAWLAGFVMLVSFSVALPGCGGCRKKDAKTAAEKEAERLKKEREKKKPDFEIATPTSLPAGYKQFGCHYKPGHWTSTVIETKANKEDFAGSLEISVLRDKGTKPVALDAVPYSVIDGRAVALSKGSAKQLHGTFFVPPLAEPVSGRLNLRARRGLQRLEYPFIMSRMFAHQYHFAVLARSPDRYGFIRSLYSIKPPDGDSDNPKEDFHYQVALMKVDHRASLPSDAMFWTSIAYVIWDDIKPKKSLSPDQQHALIDWLHWGGQLIISGPDTLDTLRGSFLADYLPATAGESWTLTPADFEQLNQHFTLAGQRPLVPVGQWSGVRLRLTAGAQYVPNTGRLLAEHRVGRGRVVVSAVRLSDRSLIQWDGFDGFFNACLLRRPARILREKEFGKALVWADARRYKPDDAAVTCKLRYFSRDEGMSPEEYTRAPKTAATSTDPSNMYAGSEPVADGTGVAAWRNFSPVANLARGTLKRAACVEVPGRWFVIWIIAVYLAVLVPLNWFIFSALGRVEWAWAVAPLIAIVCTMSVVHLARLDIGFARSETSLGVLELQGRYPRAHLTRYTALYTSLTTRYEFSQDDTGALVQPFPKVLKRDDFHMLPGQGLDTLRRWHGKDVNLRGFSVPSNFVDYIHAEQMVELKGSLEIARDSQGQQQLVNWTGLPLHGVGIIKRNNDRSISTAWIGELDRMGSAALTFVRSTEGKAPWWPDRRGEDEATRNNAKKGQLNLRELTDLAENVDELQPGEIRLVAWTDAPVEGMKISPGAPQSRQALLVVAHLHWAEYGPPEVDKGSVPRVKSAL